MDTLGCDATLITFLSLVVLTLEDVNYFYGRWMLLNECKKMSR